VGLSFRHITELCIIHCDKQIGNWWHVDITVTLMFALCMKALMQMQSLSEMFAACCCM